MTNGRPRPSFRYAADPVCLVAVLLYAVNRWLLKPHGVGGAFGHAFFRGYLNDVLCLPLFLPPILFAQRLLGLRRHDDGPRLWEVLQHWLVFSVVFEVVLPRFPQWFRTTADPLDVVAYLAGGLGAWAAWRSATAWGRKARAVADVTAARAALPRGQPRRRGTRPTRRTVRRPTECVVTRLESSADPARSCGPNVGPPGRPPFCIDGSGGESSCGFEEFVPAVPPGRGGRDGHDGEGEWSRNAQDSRQTGPR